MDNHRRIVMISLAAGAVVTAFPIGAAPVPSIGVLTPHRDDRAFPVFFETLRRLGYRENVNIKIIVRSADAKLDSLPALAQELVQARVDVLIAVNTPGAAAAIRATRNIPIVMALVGDPLGSGFDSNLARPGGNVTGISNMSGELAPKRLSLLKELVPASKRIAALYNPADPITAPQIRDTESAASKLAVDVKAFPVKATAEMPEVFRSVLAWRADSALWLSGQSVAFQPLSLQLALKHRLPVIVPQRVDVEAGGLISYFPDHAELFRRAAMYVDRILKGATPADLPVEQPTKFELAINRKTAKALGLVIPQSLLISADKVIE